MFKLTPLAAISVIILGACSSSSNDYEALCDLSIRMDAASAGPHGQDPGAITDPEKMKQLRITITDLAVQMRDQSPPEIEPDMVVMVESLTAMDKIFEDNNYDLTAMAKIEDVRTKLDAIQYDPKVVQASERFASFMEENCGP